MSLALVYALLEVSRRALQLWQRYRFYRATPHLLSSFPVTETLVYGGDFNKQKEPTEASTPLVSRSGPSASVATSSGRSDLSTSGDVVASLGSYGSFTEQWGSLQKE